jgi:hypothetical protein
MLTLLGRVLFLSSASAFGILALLYQPLPQDNLKAFQDCSKLHPVRYCRITYLPSTIKTMAKE